MSVAMRFYMAQKEERLVSVNKMKKSAETKFCALFLCVYKCGRSNLLFVKKSVDFYVLIC